MPYAAVSDTRLHYDEAGGGETALFIHGFPLDHRLWRYQLAELGSQRRCLAPDLRGFGASATSSLERLAMEQHADDLRALLDALGVERADVVGLSMGGYVALALWERHRDVVRTLTLADTRAGADSPESRARRDTTIERVIEEGRLWLADDVSGSLLAPDADVLARARLRTMAEETAYETIVAALRGMRDRRDRTELLATIDVPTLVMVGEHDAITPPDEAERTAAAISHARLVRIERAGHLTPIERPTAFNAALRDLWT